MHVIGSSARSNGVVHWWVVSHLTSNFPPLPPARVHWVFFGPGATHRIPGPDQGCCSHSRTLTHTHAHTVVRFTRVLLLLLLLTYCALTYRTSRRSFTLSASRRPLLSLARLATHRLQIIEHSIFPTCKIRSQQGSSLARR